MLIVVQASLIGSILGNLLLVAGLSLLWGGIKYPNQEFSKDANASNGSLLLLAVVALMLPSALGEAGVERQLQAALAGVGVDLGFEPQLLDGGASFLGAEPAAGHELHACLARQQAHVDADDVRHLGQVALHAGGAASARHACVATHLPPVRARHWLAALVMMSRWVSPCRQVICFCSAPYTKAGATA